MTAESSNQAQYSKTNGKLNNVKRVLLSILAADRIIPTSFPRSSVRMPSSTLCVVFRLDEADWQRTRSVQDDIPTRSVERGLRACGQ